MTLGVATAFVAGMRRAAATTTVLAMNSNRIAAGQIRSASTFFNQSKSAEELWKATTSVSNTGRKRGRAKGMMRVKDLNVGQKLGIGPAMMSWPGLTDDPARKGRQATADADIGKLAERDYQQYVSNVQDRQLMRSKRKGRFQRQTPLERGWTSKRPQGRVFGPPQPASPSICMDDFESILVQNKFVMHMTGLYGRCSSASLLMVTGNGKGMVGYAISNQMMGKKPISMQKAVNRAGLKLCHIDLYEDRTVYHDFFTQFGSTRLFVQQRPPGFGVAAHRIIVAICRLVGIKDLHVKHEGANNNLHIVKAFILGLLRQRSHQTLADEKGLHLVELREENDFFPRVVASPSDGKVRTKREILPNEILDFEMIAHDGNIPNFKPTREPFYRRLDSWDLHLRKMMRFETHYEQRVQMLAEQGRVASHLTDLFPECTPADHNVWLKKKREQKEEAGSK